MTSEEIRNKIKKELSKAEVELAFKLMEQHAHELSISPKEVLLFKANYYKVKREFDQNLISRDTFDRNFARTVDGIQSFLNNQISSDQKGAAASRSFLWLGDIRKNYLILFVTVMLVLTGVFFLTTLKQENASENEIGLVEKAEKIYREIKDRTVTFNQKEELITKMIKLLDVQTVVYLKGENGNIVNQYQLEKFLQEVRLGQHADSYIENIREEKITIRYSK